MREHARFLAWLAVCVALLALLPLANFAVILRSGELDRPAAVAQALHDRGALYGSGLHDVRGELPLEILRLRDPEIVALGSSRALDMRQEFFTRPFACACGVLDSIDDAAPYLDSLLAAAQPRQVLFLLDFWWFTTRAPQRRPVLDFDGAAQLTRDKILRPVGWVREGTLTPVEYLRLMAGERDFTRVIPPPKIGVMAIKRGIGTRADGSLLNGLRLLPEAHVTYANIRQQMHDAGSAVLAGPRRPGEHSRLGPDNVLVPERLAALDGALARLKAAGAQVTLVLPPVAPPIAQAMRSSGRHGYLEELDRALRARGLAYFNFHDPATFGGADLCEFGDAYHSGNVSFMRMLRAMAQKDPRGALARALDRPALDQAIGRFAGRTIASFAADGDLPPEVDYLAAGCRRSEPK